jgi:O-antigen/teichoic acid export membrane protein
MLEHVRRLSAQTLIFGLGEAVTRVAAVLLLPIFTRVLSPEDYGRVAIVTLVTTVVAIVFDWGQRSAFFWCYYRLEGQVERRRLTGTVLVYLLGSAALSLALLQAAWGPLGGVLFKDAELQRLIRIALLGVLFDVGAAVPFATFRAEMRAGSYATLSVVRFAINASLNIVAVVVLRWGVWGIVYANLATSVVFFAVCLVLVARRIEWTLDRALLRQLLRFGLPLVAANLAGWSMTFMDRYLVERWAGLKQVGLYAVAYTIAGIVNMVQGCFNTAYVPYCLSIQRQPDARLVYARILRYVMAVLVGLGLAVSLLSREILSFASSPAYGAAATVVPLLVCGFLVTELSYLLALGLDLTGKTAWYPLIVGLGAITSLTLNCILIPRFGMRGAAVASPLAAAAMATVCFVTVRRLYPVPYEWGRLLALVLVAVAVYFVGALVKTQRVWLDLGVAAGLAAVGALPLLWTLLTASERATLRALVRRYAGRRAT